MGEGYAAIQRVGGLPGGGGGQSNDSKYWLFYYSKEAFKYVMLFKTGHGNFAIHKDLLFLKHL
jgi:hypothetical protein